MKLYVVGDEITVRAFSLIGIQGQIVAEDISMTDLKFELKKILDREEIGLVIFNRFIRELLKEDFDEFQNLTRPLFMEVPNAGESPREEDIQKYIQQIVGIKF